MTPEEHAIIDAAFQVAVFSKTHEWPRPHSPEFFEFANKLDRLQTALERRYPALRLNIQKAVPPGS